MESKFQLKLSITQLETNLRKKNITHTIKAHKFQAEQFQSKNFRSQKIIQAKALKLESSRIKVPNKLSNCFDLFNFDVRRSCFELL